uniref:NAC domain-containing protein n=1 Tax=Leersia perrieri TaxID=77586 RepID=A0A0D9X5M2_9ORYZ
MADSGVCITLVDGTTRHLPIGSMFRPTDGELVFHYLYQHAIQMPLPLNFIPSIDILRHNPWDIVPAQEKKNGKHFFTRKENKNPGDQRRNRATGNGFWKSTGSEVTVYYKPNGSADDILVGMKRTLVFYRGKSSSAERTEWVMQEFRLAGWCLSHCPVMGQVTNGGSSNAEVTIAMTNDGGLSAAPTQVLPDSSWLICRIYAKRQRAPQVIIPPAFGNAQEVMIPPAGGNAGEGRQVRFIDFVGQAPRAGPSSPTCSIELSYEGGDECTDEGDAKDSDNHGKGI